MTAGAVIAAPRIHIPNPFHLDIVGSLLSAVGRVFTAGAQSLASWAFDRMTAALIATTQVNLTGWFTGPWRAMLAVAAVLALPILLTGVLTEVIAGRPAGALRRGVLLPLLVAPALLAARAVLGLLLALVNGACALVVQLSIGGSSGYATALNHMRGTFGITGAGVPGGDGIVSVLIVLVTGFLCFVIWIELALRAAMIYLLAAFIPLSLAGLFWSATSRWTRRLVEVLAAVVLAQLVITVVMVLAAAALAGHTDGLAAGIDTVAVGLALLFLGTLGLPMTFRLVPHVLEASVVAGTGAAVAQRMRQHSAQALSAIPHPAAQAAGAGLAGRPGAAVLAAHRGSTGARHQPQSTQAQQRGGATAAAAGPPQRPAPPASPPRGQQP